MGAQAEIHDRKTVLRHGGALPREAGSEGGRLSAQGSGLRARQTKGGLHAPEIPTPTPAVDLSFNIEGLTNGPDVVGGLFSPANRCLDGGSGWFYWNTYLMYPLPSIHRDDPVYH